jgi:hypothetical protein
MKKKIVTAFVSSIRKKELADPTQPDLQILKKALSSWDDCWETDPAFPAKATYFHGRSYSSSIGDHLARFTFLASVELPDRVQPFTESFCETSNLPGILP